MLPSLLARTWNPGRTSAEFFDQWHNPADVFSVLLILGGDVVARALAQLSGSRVTPVAFSFVRSKSSLLVQLPRKTFDFRSFD